MSINTPFPRRFGSGKKRRYRAIYSSLCQAMGTAYDTSPTSNVVPEIHAETRLLMGLWSGNRRVANQFDPDRMTDMLPRWEHIFGLTVTSDDTLAERRTRVKARMALLGNPNLQGVQDAAEILLGAVLVGIEYTPIASANIHWPGTGEPNAWYSTVAHILFRTDKTFATSDAAFWRAVSIARTFFRDFLPVWMTFDFGMDATTGGGVFRFDEPDFDLETFS